jgi:HEPN domain-containing protein
MNKKVEYWLELAEYDITTAEAMQQTGRYLYVGFMCHQTVEKALKAVIARDCMEGEIPPKTHDLSKLAVHAKLIDAMSEDQQDFLEILNPLNIESRYPEYKKQLMSMLTKDKCEKIIARTGEFLCWIKRQLSAQSNNTPML